MISQMTRTVATMLPPLLRVPLRMAARYPRAGTITPAGAGPSSDRVLSSAPRGLGSADDDDRARGTGDDVLAGRAEQHAREPTAATAADDEQVRLGGCVQQDRRGV